MKYGGNATGGTREDGKKNIIGKGKNAGGTAGVGNSKENSYEQTKNKTKTNNNGEDSVKGSNLTDMEVELETGDTATDVEMHSHDEEARMGNVGSEVEGTEGDGNSSARYATIVKDSHTDANVQRWEREVVNWEKEVSGAATKEFKTLAEFKLQNARLMLKEALVRMTTVDNLDLYDSDTFSDPGMGVNKDNEDIQDAEVVYSDDNEDVEEGEDDESTETLDRNVTDKEDNNQGDKNPIDYENNEKTGKMRVTAIANWGDVSDDETVIQHNQENQWKMVKDKKHNKNNKSDKASNQGNEYQQRVAAGKTKIINPYTATSSKLNNKGQKPTAIQTEQMTKSSLTSYLEITKDSIRKQNQNSVRVNMSFTPRTSGFGELLRVAKEILTFGKEVDEKILLLSWDERAGVGPIHLDDLANPNKIGDNIKKYFDKPQYVNFQPGSPVYGIGIHISTNLTKHKFMTRWNLNKQEYKKNNRAAYSISLAPMQHSPTAFIIGIAVGSTEKQDYEILNMKLSEDTGIEGIEVSFQNINQARVTQEFWKLANDKALTINKDKYSREHLREKYRWAPNSLAIYVPRRELVAKARKTMIGKYGKSVDGRDPIWPDGSSMRFLPIKGPAIKNEKT